MFGIDVGVSEFFIGASLFFGAGVEIVRDTRVLGYVGVRCHRKP